jgi:hypothetical protein
MERKGETYLGDGLYASDDGLHIILRTERDTGEHWVGLDPEVLLSLFRFIERTRGVTIQVREASQDRKEEV